MDQFLRPGQSANPSIRFHFPDNNFIFVNSKRLRFIINRNDWADYIKSIQSAFWIACNRNLLESTVATPCGPHVFSGHLFWNDMMKLIGINYKYTSLTYTNIFRHCDFLSNTDDILEKCVGGYLFVSCQMISYFEAFTSWILTWLNKS